MTNSNQLDDSTIDAQINVSELAERARVDYRLFIALIMGELLTMVTPEFHLVVFARMVALDVPQSVFAIPRGFAKTTIARIAVVYILTFTKIRNIFYFSNTLDLSIPSVNAIVKFLKSPNYRKIFGEVHFTVEQEGKGYYQFIMPNGKECTLRARGANQQVRGANFDNVRIELAICDDLEDREDNNNDALYKKLKQWFYGDLKKALDKRFGKIIMIGNIVSRNSMVAENCESPNWYSMRYSAIKSNGEPLWAELWSKEALRRDYEEYASQGLTSLWFGEMMNVIMPEGSQLISANEILYRDRPSAGQLECGFITIDPAISENQETAHKCVIAVHGYFDDKWQIIDHYSAIATDPIKLYDHTLRLANLWGINAVGIESEAYQASIKYVFEYIQRRNDMEAKLQIFQMPTGKKSKYTRIASWVGYLKSHDYCLTKGDIQTATQLFKYDSTRKQNDDDLIDAEAYGVYMINNHLSTIMQLFKRRLDAPPAAYIDYSPL